MKIDAKVLVFDSEKAHLDVLFEDLDDLCDYVQPTYRFDDLLAQINDDFDFLIADIKPNDGINAAELVHKIHSINPDCKIIITTAFPSIDSCKEAIKAGAADYLVKPFEIEQLNKILEDGFKSQRSFNSRANSLVSKINKDSFGFNGIVGKNPQMLGLFRILRKVSPTNLPVVIEGESGTGKELIAQSIHLNSPRRNMIYRPINCAGLTESLLESELFGHSKGAFTGATTDRKGLFEIANRGTLFLDEIGDMPLNMQAKLLRVLEDGTIIPVGSDKVVNVDVRIVSATNHNLAKLVEEKKFRQDLFFRIKGVSVTIPPLRNRQEDIPELASFFISQANDEIGSDINGISDSAMKILQGYTWPGNIRQLKNAIKMMVVMAEGNIIDVGDIPPDIYRLKQLGSGITENTEITGIKLNDLEKQAIASTLNQVEGNREKAAKILGIGERTLYRKIKEYNIEK